MHIKTNEYRRIQQDRSERRFEMTQCEALSVQKDKAAKVRNTFIHIIQYSSP